MSAGLFLSIEGIDGSGKSTQLELLTARLKREAVPYLLNREPGGSEVGNQIRQILLEPKNPVSPTAELLLYFANRAQNVDEQIRPALGEGKLVISDRYTDSTSISGLRCPCRFVQMDEFPSRYSRPFASRSTAP